MESRGVEWFWLGISTHKDCNIPFWVGLYRDLVVIIRCLIIFVGCVVGLVLSAYDSQADGLHKH